MTKPHEPERLAPATLLDLNFVGDTETHRLTLAEFRAANRDGCSTEEMDEIEAGLVAAGRFEGGGGASPRWSLTLAVPPPNADDTPVLALFGNGPPASTTLADFFAAYGDKLPAMERRWIVDTVRAGDFHMGGGLDKPLPAFWVVRADHPSAVNIVTAYAATQGGQRQPQQVAA